MREIFGDWHYASFFCQGHNGRTTANDNDNDYYTSIEKRKGIHNCYRSHTSSALMLHMLRRRRANYSQTIIYLPEMVLLLLERTSRHVRYTLLSSGDCGAWRQRRRAEKVVQKSFFARFVRITACNEIEVHQNRLEWSECLWATKWFSIRLISKVPWIPTIHAIYYFWKHIFSAVLRSSIFFILPFSWRLW